jgi:hypothetical protein
MVPELMVDNHGTRPMPYQRKADDRKIIEFNNLGLSLTGIGERLNVHPTTVSNRLKELRIDPIDTRRAFMEDIFEALAPAQQEWLIQQLGPGYTVKDFVRALLIKEYVNRTTAAGVTA